MNFSGVKTFVKKVRDGFLATTDGKKVGVRLMGSFAWMGKELWCATGKSTDKIKQLKKVPFAEYCFAKRAGEHIRIYGRCKVSTSNADKLKLYKAVPLLKKYIEDPKDPEYVVIRMKPHRIRWMKSAALDYKTIKI